MKAVEIQSIIDTYLIQWVDAGLNRLPRPIEPAMADPAQDPAEEWKT
jgi:hypothetical protein